MTKAAEAKILQEQVRGKVVWFNESKGFGFIKPEEGPDLFVHWSGIDGQGRRNLLPEQLVIFNIVQGEKGPMATGVRVTSSRD